MKLIILSRDLMFTSRLEGVARKLALTVAQASDMESAVAIVAAGDCRFLIVDLQLPNLDVKKLVDGVRASNAEPVQIIACGPHVHAQRLEAARQAGCDQVVSRGQLDREAEAILQA